MYIDTSPTDNGQNSKGTQMRHKIPEVFDKIHEPQTNGGCIERETIGMLVALYGTMPRLKTLSQRLFFHHKERGKSQPGTR